jgi:hypothetical protein
MVLGELCIHCHKFSSISKEIMKFNITADSKFQGCGIRILAQSGSTKSRNPDPMRIQIQNRPCCCKIEKMSLKVYLSRLFHTPWNHKVIESGSTTLVNSR